MKTETSKHENFEIKLIKEGVYIITEPKYTEHCNMYLFDDGEHQLLVDSGVGIPNISTLLQARGFRDVRVFITHAHYDHIGGLKYFNPDQVIVPSRVHANLKLENLFALEYLEQIHLDGFDAEQLRLEIAGVTKIPFTPFTEKFINLGKFEFDIFHFPGHSDDCYCLYDRRNSILVSGDVLYDGQRYDSLPNSNKTEYITSLEDLRHLKFDLCLPGHNRVLNNAEARDIAQAWINDLSK